LGREDKCDDRTEGSHGKVAKSKMVRVLLLEKYRFHKEEEKMTRNLPNS